MTAAVFHSNQATWMGVSEAAGIDLGVCLDSLVRPNWSLVQPCATCCDMYVTLCSYAFPANIPRHLCVNKVVRDCPLFSCDFIASGSASSSLMGV